MTTPNLSWSKQGETFVLAGRIDEHADLDRLAREVPSRGAALDLSGIVRINSVGTREWMQFLQGLEDRAITLERCSPAIVEQLNAVANFQRRAVVKSVQALYECDACATALTMDYDLATAFPDGDVSQVVAPLCKSCGQPMELDDAPLRYFRFVKVQAR